MRIVIGFCNACAFTAMESWLSESSTEEKRGRVLAIYQAVILGAIFLGQFLINLAPAESDSLFIVSGIILCAAIIPIVLSRHSGPVVTEVAPMSLLSLLRLSPLGVITCFVAGVTYSAVFNMLPIYADGFGISGFDLSVFMGFAVSGAFLLQFPVGYLSDHYDRRSVLLVILLLSAVSGFFVNLLAAAEWFFVMGVATAVSSGIIACLYPLSISESFDRVRKSELVSAMGSLIFAFSLGGIIGPYTTSLVMSGVGSSSLFLFVGSIQLLLGLFVVYRMTIRTSVPEDQQESFVMQSVAAPIMADLDPRTEHTGVEPMLSEVAEAALMVAENDPAAAVKMTQAVVAATPEQGVEMAAAVASADEVDAVRLYQAILETRPDKLAAITQAIVEAQPDLAYELVSQLARKQPDKMIEIATQIGEAVPEARIDMARLAVEEEPDAAVEVAERLAHAVAEDHDNVRYADRGDDTSEQDAADLVTNIAELVPESTLDVAVAVIEAVPESASRVVEVLRDSGEVQGSDLVSSIDEHEKGGE